MPYNNFIFLFLLILNFFAQTNSNNKITLMINALKTTKNSFKSTQQEFVEKKVIKEDPDNDKKTSKTSDSDSKESTKTKKPKKITSEKDRQAKFKSAKVTDCDDKNCPPDIGTCSGTSKCNCENKYANAPKLSKKTCSYKRKSQKTAFLLEFFIPFGAGHFYVGKWWLGLIKMICTLFAMITIYSFLICCLSCVQNQKSYAAYMFFYYFVPILASVWWLVDIILFGIDYFLDNNGVPLYTW